MFSSSNDYPIIQIPDGIRNAFQYVPADDEIAKILGLKKPIPPKPPMLPVLPSRKAKRQVTKTKLFSKVGCAWIFITPMIFVSVCNLFYSLYYGDFKVSIFFFGLLLFFCLSFFRIEKNTSEVSINLTSEEYEKLEVKYLDELAKYYNDEEKYKFDYVKYENDILNYERCLAGMRSKAELQIFQLKIAPTELATRNKEVSKRGRVEMYFLEELINWFGDRIKADYKPSNYNGSYLPDFSYVCPFTNLHVDIEIDEPYALLDNKPIHFIGSGDEDRNNFFLSKNWVVIRFSENQVINNREECCMQIDEIVKSIVNMKDRIQLFLEPHKRWTYEEALIMAKNKLRQQVLDKVINNN